MESLAPQTLRYLEAYALGVNAGLADVAGRLPPEFVALGYEPRPWTALDSLAISKLQAMSIALWETDLARLVGQGAAGAEKLEQLDDSYPKGAPTVSPTPHELGLGPAVPGVSPDDAPSREAQLGPEPADASADRARASDAVLAAAGLQLDGLWDMRGLIQRASAARASNAFAVSGAHTASKRPLVANDMHLELQAPSLWYMASLRTARWFAAGLTIPGLPFILSGRTAHVAWGLTASNVDEVDLYVEEFDPQSQDRYLTPDGPAAFTRRAERILVKGAPAVEHVVRASRHGPLLSDVDERNRKGKPAALALRWTLHDHPRAADGFLRMLHAQSAQEFDAALREVEAPALSVVFADRQGNIGYRLTGRVPVRPEGVGPWPLSGNTRDNDWLGYLPPEEMPAAMNPDDGLLIAANHRPHPWTDGRYFGTQWASPFRALRLRELLAPATALSADDAARLQLDLLDLHAVRYKGFAAQSAVPGAVGPLERPADPGAGGRVAVHWVCHAGAVTQASESGIPKSGFSRCPSTHR